MLTTLFDLARWTGVALTSSIDKTAGKRLAFFASFCQKDKAAKPIREKRPAEAGPMVLLRSYGNHPYTVENTHENRFSEISTAHRCAFAVTFFDRHGVGVRLFWLMATFEHGVTERRQTVPPTEILHLKAKLPPALSAVTRSHASRLGELSPLPMNADQRIPLIVTAKQGRTAAASGVAKAGTLRVSSRPFYF